MARTPIHWRCCRNPVTLGNAGSARCSLRRRAGPSHSSRHATLCSPGSPAQPGNGSDLGMPYELFRDQELLDAILPGLARDRAWLERG